MKLFRRSKPVEPNVPPEVAEYYQAERRSRRGMTWLVTIIALLVTIAIVVGLFLAGRWAYNAVKGRQSPPSSDQAAPASNDQNVGSNSTPEASSHSDNTTQPNSSESDSSEQPSSPNTPSSQEDTTPREAPSDTSDRSDASSNTTTSDQELTNTGPGTTALLLFVASAMMAYVGYRLKLARQQA